MTSSREDGALPRLKPRDEIDELFGRTNPNPDRIGCPPREVLIALALRGRPIGDPAYEHLIKCSPCYLEVRGFQEAAKAERRRRLLKTTAWVTAAAAVLLIAVTAGPNISPRQRSQGDSELSFVPSSIFALTLSHGACSNGATCRRFRWHADTARCCCACLPAQIQESTKYSSSIRSLLRKRQQRETPNSGTKLVLQATLDLTTLARGSYQLAIRRNGQPWQMFPAQVP
jgi:hypothetical protein